MPAPEDPVGQAAADSPLHAWLLAMAFVFATNLYVSCTRGNVWALGQGLGYSLAILGAGLVMLSKSAGAAAAGYYLLSMAVGCRPFLLFLTPLSWPWIPGPGAVRQAGHC